MKSSHKNESKLSLRRETLRELTTADLRAVVAGTSGRCNGLFA